MVHPAESYSGHKKRAVFKTALVPQYNKLSNYRITAGEQVGHLPQASLIKGRFGGIVDIRLAGLPCRVLFWAQKNKSSRIATLIMCHTLTDYRTIVEDFYKVVEFVEWLKEYYPEKIPLIVESK